LERTSGLSISVNISAKTLGDLKFVDLLEGKCRDTGISPEAVILEVTETAAMDDQLLALDMFTRLRMKGFQVSIDDFGIGNSSLALLARLPFSEIKVDRSFAMSATKSEESRAIIKSTVDLSHSLDLTVVTEGVEDRETLDFLQEIGCDLAQGYYIARPMPGDAVVEWMLQRRESTRHNML
jgi:EAL domain-containing protein (putative c-di-GMP-specific phosphodiesterase class I)